MWNGLPLLQIVVEVVVERHRHVTVLHLEKELSVGDRLLIALDQVIGQPVDQGGANVLTTVNHYILEVLTVYQARVILNP